MTRYPSVLCMAACVAAFLAVSPARAGLSLGGEHEPPPARPDSGARRGLSLSFDASAENFSKRWALEVGVAGITDKTISSILTGDIHFPSGPRGGMLYHFGASYLLGEAVIGWGEHEFRPQLDVPVFIEVFDENSRDPFPSYNAALRARWVDFPWNDYLRTSAAIGWGLSYSARIPLMERRREDRRDRRLDRTHLKFALPIDISFAHPRWPQHQIMFFLSHQSAGRWFGIFGRGGVNSVGIGYRWGYD